VISADLRIERFDRRQLENLQRLMDPPVEARDGSATTLRGEALRWLDRLTETRSTPSATGDPPLGLPVLLLLREGRPIRGFRLGGEQVPLDGLADASRASLRAFRQRQGCSLVIALDGATLPELLARIQQSVRPGSDLVAQLLAMARVVRAERKPPVLLEPEPKSKLPLPSFELLQSTFDRMLPHSHTLVFYLLHERQIWTSLIVRQRGGDIDLITSHAALEPHTRLESLRDAPKLLDQVKRRFGPPHIGAFISLGSWRRFVEGDRAAIGRALAAGEALLDPCPPWLLAIVGAGALSEAANRSARLAGRLLKRAPIGGQLLGSGAERMAARIANPLETLGLDPWELIRAGREWTQQLAPLLRPTD
jgi:hypothetical protein